MDDLSQRPPTDAEMAELLGFLRGLPPAVLEVAERFPPGAIVRAGDGHRLICPAPGKIGLVTSYLENDDDTVSVNVEGGSVVGPIAAACDPDWLEVVEDASAEQRDWFATAKAMLP